MSNPTTKPRSFRMSDDRWARIQRAAKDEGMSASDWVCSKLDLFLSDDPDALPLTNRQMQKIARTMMVMSALVMHDSQERYGKEVKEAAIASARRTLDKAR